MGFPLIICIVCGLLLAVIGIKKGLFYAWVLWFNVLIAVFLGIMSAPVLVPMVLKYSGSLSGFADIILIGGVAIVYFVISQILAHVFFTGTYCVSIARPADVIGGGLFGFHAGYTAAGFLLLLVFVSPLVRQRDVAKFVSADSAGGAAKSVVCSCNLIMKFSGQYRMKRCDKVVSIISAEDYQLENETDDAAEDEQQYISDDTVNDINQPADSNQPDDPSILKQ